MADQPDDGADVDDGSEEASNRAPSRPDEAGDGPNGGSGDADPAGSDPADSDADPADPDPADPDPDPADPGPDPADTGSEDRESTDDAGAADGSGTNGPGTDDTETKGSETDDAASGSTWADSEMGQPSIDAARRRPNGAPPSGGDDAVSESEDPVADDGDGDATGDEEAADDPGSTPRAETDGEGYVGDHPDRNHQEPAYPDPDGESSYPDPDDEPPYPDPDDDVGGISQPPGDEEMPLADHIEEMVLRFAVAVLVGAAVTAIGLLWASDAIWIIWNDIFAHLETLPPPHVYNPIELWLARIKVAALAGILAALPVFVYETYLFMRPGLYPNERRYYLASVPLSLVLGIVGMVYSYYLVLPVLFRYFTYYSEGSAEIAYGLGDTFNLVITLTGFLAIVFQIPLFIMLAIMMGVTTRRWLADKRLYFWGGFAVLAGTFTMDPTLMAAILVALTMIVLFEGTLLLLKWVGRE